MDCVLELNARNRDFTDAMSRRYSDILSISSNKQDIFPWKCPNLPFYSSSEL